MSTVDISTYPLVICYIAMERSTHFSVRSTMYFYGPSIPWRTVSHNQRVAGYEPTFTSHQGTALFLGGHSPSSSTILNDRGAWKSLKFQLIQSSKLLRGAGAVLERSWKIIWKNGFSMFHGWSSCWQGGLWYLIAPGLKLDKDWKRALLAQVALKGSQRPWRDTKCAILKLHLCNGITIGFNHQQQELSWW